MHFNAIRLLNIYIPLEERIMLEEIKFKKKKNRIINRFPKR